MNINLENYRVFYTVARAGSISAAAQQLHLSQPAVSQAIKNLESGLMAQLFTRGAKGVTLTPEGESLYRYVSRGYESFLQAEALFQGRQDLETGEVRVGASDLTLQFYLLPYLEAFHREYPKVKIVVTNGPTPETMGILHRGGIDFGLVTSPMEPVPWAKVTELCELEDWFVANHQYEHLRGRCLSVEEIAALPLVMLEPNTSTRRSARRWFEQAGCAGDPEFELATSDLIVQFALRGLGVGLVNAPFARHAVETGDLFRLKTRIPLPTRQICLAVPKDRHLSPAGQRLLEYLPKKLPG